MNKHKHMKPLLMVIAPKYFRDEELFETKEELLDAGLTTVTASLSKGICTGSKEGKTIAEVEIQDLNTNDYQGVVFVGGPGSRIYFEHPEAHRIAKEMNADEKLVAAICIAPVILAKAGLLKDKSATVFNSEIETLKKNGGHYTGLALTQDENIITANGPQSSRAFGELIAKTIKENKMTLKYNHQIK